MCPRPPTLIVQLRLPHLYNDDEPRNCAFGSMSTCWGFTEGVGGGRTQHTDQYIISYKLNSTWIDPGGVCDRLKTADHHTVNPTDHCSGVGRRRWMKGAVAKRRWHPRWWVWSVMERSWFGAGGGRQGEGNRQR